MADLLSKLGKKGEAQAVGPDSTANTTEAKSSLIEEGSDGMSRGDNLINKAPTKVDKEFNSNAKTHTEEESSEEKVVKEPDTWTKDSALKEMVKLREEAKTTRIKYKEQMEMLKEQTQKEMEALKEQFKESAEAKKKLEALEAEQADKKRDLTEKLAHRESMIAELKAQMDALKQQNDARMKELAEKVTEFEAEKEAKMQVYRERISEELESVPEKFRKFASSIVKAHSDPQEGWSALAEAKAQGLFSDKQIVVNHNTPGASDGARLSQDKLDALAKAERENLTPSQKIKAGLDAIRGGNTNTVFRNK